MHNTQNTRNGVLFISWGIAKSHFPVYNPDIANSQEEKMGKRFDDFRERIGLRIKKSLAKNYGFYLVGPRKLSFKLSDRQESPFFGIWHYCRACDWFGFVDLYDPWSYSSRSYCGNCNMENNYNPNTLTPTLSFDYLQLCAESARKRHPNGKRFWLEFIKLKWLGLDSESIPTDRGNMTYQDLESICLLSAFSLMTKFM